MRIVAGSHRGRRIATPPGRVVRPTSDRVREALFNILVDVEDASVLDLYSGTGALALEALSRGAASAVLVEADRAVYELMRSNVAELGFDRREPRVVTMHADARRALQRMERSGARFDLVFLDPPYAATMVQLRGIGGLVLAVTRSGATIVVEGASRDVAAIQELLGVQWGVRLVTVRRYGDTTIVIAETPSPVTNGGST